MDQAKGKCQLETGWLEKREFGVFTPQLLLHRAFVFGVVAVFFHQRRLLWPTAAWQASTAIDFSPCPFKPRDGSGPL